MPFILTLAGAAALVAAARLLRKEWVRVNRELDAASADAPSSAPLRRDPKTGEWRPG